MHLFLLDSFSTEVCVCFPTSEGGGLLRRPGGGFHSGMETNSVTQRELMFERRSYVNKSRQHFSHFPAWTHPGRHKTTECSRTEFTHTHGLFCPPQLGPNPSFLDGEKLSRGQSGKLTHGGTLYLVNQSHPFKLHYSLSSNGSASNSAQRGLKAPDKTKGGRNGKQKEEQPSPTPKRSIKDFFSTSPMKVTHVVLFGY